MALCFEEELLLKDIDRNKYLQQVRLNGLRHDYNWRSIRFAPDNQHKIQITHPDTGERIRFGACEYNDFIIYTMMAERNEITHAEARKRRENFRKRMIVKDDNKYSSRNLSIALLWT
jgi:hypothetical protein